jgi:hypothetical protein
MGPGQRLNYPFPSIVSLPELLKGPLEGHSAIGMMTAALAETLAMVAQAARDAADEWWIIGSAAVVLHGGELAHVKDVDLMMSARDAEAFLRRTRSEHGGAEASDRFASDVFGVWKEPSIPVEVFGGFRLAVDGQWRHVSFSTREPLTVAGARVYVPSSQELVGLLRSFGRSKDLERARLLRR